MSWRQRMHYLQKGGVFIPPPDPDRFPGHELGENPPPEDMPDDGQWSPDYDPFEAEQLCAETGGEWDGRICSYQRGCPAGTHWDADAMLCVPNGPNDHDDPTEPVPPGPNPGPGPTLPPGFVAPGPTAIAIGNWDTDATPYARYQLAYGDTYVGLAKTYLDPTGKRWNEIWGLNRAQHPSPDVIYATQIINMPAEARDNFVSWMNRGSPGGELPSQNGGVAGAKRTRMWLWVAGGAAALAGGYWLLSR